MNETTITTVELIEQLPEILDRVQHQQERFIVMRDGAPVARIEPHLVRGVTLRELIAMICELPRPDDRFADDLEEIHASQPLLGSAPRPS